MGGARGRGLELRGDCVSEGADVSVEITKQQHAAMGLEQEDVITQGSTSIAAARVVAAPVQGGLGGM